MSKKCTSVSEVNDDDKDGDDGEGEDDGDDKHDYLPTEDGARCPASCNTMQYNTASVLQYNTMRLAVQYNTIQVSCVCNTMQPASCSHSFSEAAPMQHNAM